MQIDDIQNNEKVKPMKNSSVQSKFWIRYISIALVVIVCFIPPSIVTVKNTIDKEIDNQTNNLNKCALELLYYLEQADTTAYYIANMTYLSNLNRSISFTKDDAIYNLYCYRTDTPKSSFENPIVDAIMIQFSNNNLLLYNDMVFFDKEEFYSENFHYSDVSYAQWQQNLFMNDGENIYSNWKAVYPNKLEGKKVVTLNYYFPMINEPEIVISIIIDEQVLLDLLSNSDGELYQYVSLNYTYLNNDVRLLYGVNRNESYNIMSSNGALSVSADLNENMINRLLVPHFS